MFRSIPLSKDGDKARTIDKWKRRLQTWRKNPSILLRSQRSQNQTSLSERFRQKMQYIKSGTLLNRFKEGNGNKIEEKQGKKSWTKGKSVFRGILPNPLFRRSPNLYKSNNRQFIQRFSERFKNARENFKSFPNKFRLRRLSKIRLTQEENILLTRQSELPDTQISAEELMREETGAQPEDGVVFVRKIPFYRFETLSKIKMLGGVPFFSFLGTGMAAILTGSGLGSLIGLAAGTYLGVSVMRSFTPEEHYKTAMKLVEKADREFPKLMKLIQNEDPHGRVLHISTVQVDYLLHLFDRLYPNNNSRLRIFEELQTVRDIYWTANHYLWQCAEFGLGNRTSMIRFQSAALVSRNQKVLRNLNVCIKLLRNDPQLIGLLKRENE